MRAETISHIRAAVLRALVSCGSSAHPVPLFFVYLFVVSVRETPIITTRKRKKARGTSLRTCSRTRPPVIPLFHRCWRSLFCYLAPFASPLASVCTLLRSLLYSTDAATSHRFNFQFDALLTLLLVHDFEFSARIDMSALPRIQLGLQLRVLARDRARARDRRVLKRNREARRLASKMRN